MIVRRIKKYCFIIEIQIIIIFFIFICPSTFNLQAQTNSSYSFIVAGHTYGSHTGSNIGLHPNFLTSLNVGFDSSVHFFVLTGDIVNTSTIESWQQVELELTQYALPNYFVMGNHDANAIGTAVFEEKFGNTYYSFDYRHERFIILNSTEIDRSISPNQMVFLKDCLNNADDSINTVFIFFHELLWNSLEKYKGVMANSRSRYDQIKTYSNYWSDVNPLLEQYPDKRFYLFAGDVGGNTDAISAFYDNWGHITLLASGMGEVTDENYLVVTVTIDGTVAFKLVPLNAGVTMNDIDYYSVPRQPEFILGDSMVSSNLPYEYSVAQIYNADSYIWELPANASGTSKTNSIQVLFDDNFTSGTISVSASSQSFGNSAPASKAVSLNGTSINNETLDRLEVNIHQNNYQNNILEILSEKSDNFTIEIFIVDGTKIYSNTVKTFAGIKTQIELPVLPNNLYFVSVSGNQVKKVKKIVVW